MLAIGYESIEACPLELIPFEGTHYKILTVGGEIDDFEELYRGIILNTKQKVKIFQVKVIIDKTQKSTYSILSEVHVK